MKRRGGLRRKTELRRTGRLRRSAWPMPRRREPVRRVNPARIARLREQQYGGDYADWIRLRPCDGCGQRPPNLAAHAGGKTCGAGGRPWHLVTLCARCEDEWHAVGRDTFDARHDVRLRELAAELWNRGRNELGTDEDRPPG